MRTFLLLVLTIAISAESEKTNAGMVLLQECSETANHMLRNSSTESLNQYVQDVFGTEECSVNTLCKTLTVLKKSHLNRSKLHRQLHSYVVYTEHVRNCNITTSLEYTMKDLLKNIKMCCQKQYSNLLTHMHKKEKK
ncbi:interleukin-4 [Myxocyprinus asiaticus]|uniref:interleukin-4 n=1 Tax=Myxocyprinus asiaticus TaxID=70543 RepID=UPI0022222B92|nr:interleukin-4 [Myxocyprinus asiaticus]